MAASDSRSFRELLDRLAETPLGAETRDPEQVRRQTYQELAEEDDPLLREIGEQLRDGVARPHQLLDIPAYREVIEQRLELLRRTEGGGSPTPPADGVDSPDSHRHQP